MRLTNTYKKIRADWYSWTILINGTEEELEGIKYVKYFLHETFSSSQIVARDALKKFARSNSGWGEFLLHAKAFLKNGKTMSASIWLDLGFEHTKDKKKEYSGLFS